MHTHDRTYLASLGFADVDKKDSRHDLITRYLSDPIVAEKILRRFVDQDKNFTFRVSTEVPITKGDRQYKTVVGFCDLIYTVEIRRKKFTPSPDMPVAAFLDECDRRGIEMARFTDQLSYKFSENEIDESVLLGYLSANKPEIMDALMGRSKQRYEYPGESESLVVEVKANPVSAAEVIRQIKTYREFINAYGSSNTGASGWILVTGYPITPADKQALQVEKINVFTVGQAFEEWSAAQSIAPAQVDEI